MSFFGNPLRTKGAESVLLIEVSASSVAGAYVRYVVGETPFIAYARRIQIEVRVDEPKENAMLRALASLGEGLIREGAPALARASGSGSVKAIIVSFGAPWEETMLYTEQFEQEVPFTFTKDLVEAALKKNRVDMPGKRLADESVIGTILNGYDTKDPYGKETRRASVVILSSFIEESVVEGVTTTLRRLFHTKDIVPIASNSLFYQAIRKTFPHERNAVILDATGSETFIALVRNDVFTALAEVPAHTGNTDAWLETLKEKLAELAKHFPLPRTVFLLSREEETLSLRNTLDAAKLSSLWLSDNPPKVVPLLASHVSNFIRQGSPTPPDLLIILMVLFYQYCGKDKC